MNVERCINDAYGHHSIVVSSPPGPNLSLLLALILTTPANNGRRIRDAVWADHDNQQTVVRSKLNPGGSRS
jgi:hypothetical protein